MENEKKAKLILIILMCLLILIFLFSFVLGRYGLPVSEVVNVFISKIFKADIPYPEVSEKIVINIRLPRILLAVLVGGCLSVAGASYQGVFQNPMASPDILGASSGAAFGAALMILLNGNKRMITISAFLVSLFTVSLVYILASYAPGKKVVNLILSGIMIGSLFTSGTSYIKLVADPSNKLPEITYWLMGSLSGSDLSDLRFVIIPMGFGLISLFLLRWRINLLTLGDEEASTMGINVTRLRFFVVLFSTLITAASISLSGMIGWVGLVCPHISRSLVGNNYRHLLPVSALVGGGFLLIVDNVSRNLLATEIPIGILTSFIGAPFFLYLMMRKERL